jgi:hypothetical protein
MSSKLETRRFPAQFSMLEPLADDWLADSAEGRKQFRICRTYDERKFFYDLAGPLLPAALDYLDRKTLADFSTPDVNLLQLMKALGHIALSIEHYGMADEQHAAHLAAVTITSDAASR